MQPNIIDSEGLDQFELNNSPIRFGHLRYTELASEKLVCFNEGGRPQAPSATLLKSARASDGFLEHLGVDFQRRAPVQCLAWPCIE